MAKAKQKLAKAKAKAKTEQTTTRKQRYEVVRERINDLAESTESQYLELAELLSEAYHADYAAQWGYHDFQSYANEELKTGSRKAFYLVKTWDKTKELGLDRKRVEAIGWSKFRELASVINEDNAEMWLDKAEDLSYRELADEVKAFRRTVKEGGSGGVEPVTMTYVRLRLTEDHAQPFNEAVRQAKTILGTDSDAEALAHVCLDWIESQPGTPQLLPLERVIKWIEDTYSITVKLDHSKATEPTMADAFGPSEEEDTEEEDYEDEEDEEDEDDDDDEEDEEDEDEDEEGRGRRRDAPVKAKVVGDLSLDDLLDQTA